MEDIKILIKMARMYYEYGYKQEEIANIEGISKAKVSRLLDKAIQAGIVQIKVVYNLQSVDYLAKALKDYFKLKNVFVTPVIVNNPEAILNDLGKSVSMFLAEIVKDNDILGVSWGNTLRYVVENLEIYPVKNVRVVQLNGGVAKNYLSTQSAAIIEGFVRAFQAVPYMLPVPAIVDNAELAQALSLDSNVKNTLELGKQARIAILGIGRTSQESILVQAGYFENEEYNELLEKGSVGDICSRYFCIDGTIADADLNERTISIPLSDIGTKEYAIGVASGEEKAEAIIGALRGQYINSLFIDEVSAKKCLELLNIKITEQEMK